MDSSLFRTSRPSWKLLANRELMRKLGKCLETPMLMAINISITKSLSDLCSLVEYLQPIIFLIFKLHKQLLEINCWKATSIESLYREINRLCFCFKYILFKFIYQSIFLICYDNWCCDLYKQIKARWSSSLGSYVSASTAQLHSRPSSTSTTTLPPSSSSISRTAGD